MNKLKASIFLFSIILSFVFIASNKQLIANGSTNFISKNNLAQAKVSETYSKNYIEACIREKGYLWRWHHTSFPLKIYIQSQTDKPLPSYFETDVKKAFQTWQNNSGGIVSFVFVNNKEQADIIVYFKNNALSKQSAQVTLGQTNHRVTDNILQKPVIVNLIPYNSGTVYLSSGTIYAVALHEIGHSLGLCHSPNPQDNMTPVKYLSVGRLSKSDINTLKLLYSVIPDVSDKPYNSEYRSKYVTTWDFIQTMMK